MKRQRRYTTEAMVLRDINAAHRKLKRVRDQAAAAQSEADLFAGDLDEKQKIERDKCLDRADKLWKKAERLENTRLPKLSGVLAAIRTEPLPVEGLNVRQAVLEAK